MHITDKDIFIAFEIWEHKEKRAEAEKDKKRQQRQHLIETNVLDMLSDEGATVELYSVKALDCLLVWHQVKDLLPKAKRSKRSHGGKNLWQVRSHLHHTRGGRRTTNSSYSVFNQKK